MSVRLDQAEAEHVVLSNLCAIPLLETEKLPIAHVRVEERIVKTSLDRQKYIQVSCSSC